MKDQRLDKMIEERKKMRKKKGKRVSKLIFKFAQQTRVCRIRSEKANDLMMGLPLHHGWVYVQLLMNLEELCPSGLKVRLPEKRLAFLLFIMWAKNKDFIFIKDFRKHMKITNGESIAFVQQIFVNCLKMGMAKKYRVHKGNKYWLTDEGKEFGNRIERFINDRFAAVYPQLLKKYRIKKAFGKEIVPKKEDGAQLNG